MRRVEYRGGLVVFQIPEGWADATPAAGGVWYREAPGSGTLRLHVITAKPPGTVGQKHVLEAAAAGADDDDEKPELLPNGNAIRTFWRDASEDGAPVRVRYWQLASAAPPTTIRIANFSYAFGAAETTSSEVVSALDREIRQADFTLLTAEEVEERVKAAKPWWRVW